MLRRAGQYRFVETVLAMMAVGLSAGAAAGMPMLAAWTGVLTTVVAATTAHAAVQRYDALAVEYTRACKQLERLVQSRSAFSADSARAEKHAADQFVATAEAILSAQNEAWMARNVATSDRGGGRS